MSIRPALIVLFALPLNALAGTITLLDLTDAITLMDDTGRAALACKTGESCTVTLRAPAGTTDFAQNFIGLDWIEPGTTNISDSFCTLAFPCSITAQGATIGFVSDTEGGSLGACATCVAETGMPQTAVTVTWLTATGATIATDTIRFQSDPEIPEPASAVLFLGACAVLPFVLKRQRR